MIDDPKLKVFFIALDKFNIIYSICPMTPYPAKEKTAFIHYIPRHLADIIPVHANNYPAIAIVRPRQSGKTTLARKLFPDYPYYSLESMDHQRRAIEDPRQFLHDAGSRVILDEVQRVPELFSYLQEYIDDLLLSGSTSSAGLISSC